MDSKDARTAPQLIAGMGADEQLVFGEAMDVGIGLVEVGFESVGREGLLGVITSGVAWMLGVDRGAWCGCCQLVDDDCVR